MRFALALTSFVVLAFALGACGSEDSGGSGSGSDPAVSPDDIPELTPSSNVPALVDTTGMTKAQLEAKVKEIEILIDANMQKMRAPTTALQSGGMDGATARKLTQVTADGNALRAQLMTYERALDALDR